MKKINFSLVALFVSVMLGTFITLGSGSAKADDNTIIGLFIHDANLDYAIELGLAECVSVDMKINRGKFKQLVGDKDEAERLADEFKALTKETVKLCIVHEPDDSQTPAGTGRPGSGDYNWGAGSVVDHLQPIVVMC